MLEGELQRDAELGGKSKPTQQRGKKAACSRPREQASKAAGAAQRRSNQNYRGATGEGDPLLTQRDAGLRPLERSRAKEVISYRTYRPGGMSFGSSVESDSLRSYQPEAIVYGPINRKVQL